MLTHVIIRECKALYLENITSSTKDEVGIAHECKADHEPPSAGIGGRFVQLAGSPYMRLKDAENASLQSARCLSDSLAAGPLAF